MEKEKSIKVGIGFTTGRKSFQKVLKTNVYNWRECGLTEQVKVSLNLFIAYDLKYSNTKASDYTNINPLVQELVDDICFIGGSAIEKEKEYLLGEQVLTQQEAQLFFGSGYAAKRNVVLYMAIKNHMDYLVFFDDDEYPMAVTKTGATALWGGQHVLYEHLKYIAGSDITNGHHCGYISPIPYIDFNDTLIEDDFRLFIGAISNDIINWDNIRKVMNNGGVTYADTKVLLSETAEEVAEIGGCKFISGANLCINLGDPAHVHPFYNPPGARGEDTFLSTCLHDSRVLRIPCYTFHDGFSNYKPLLDGVLPIKLKSIKADSEQVINRFYRACIGWIRYKPLLLYITQPDVYEEKITRMRAALSASLPKICAYFNRSDFMKIADELEYYHKNVKRHHRDFLATQQVWAKISRHLEDREVESLIAGKQRDITAPALDPPA